MNVGLPPILDVLAAPIDPTKQTSSNSGIGGFKRGGAANEQTLIWNFLKMGVVDPAQRTDRMIDELIFANDTFNILPHLVALALAYVLALPIGWDREREERSAGLRTFPLVAIAACGFVQAAETVLQ